MTHVFFLETTYACSFLRCAISRHPLRRSPSPLFCRRDGNTCVQKRGRTPNIWASQVARASNTKHGLYDHVARLSHICLGVRSPPRGCRHNCVSGHGSSSHPDSWTTRQAGSEFTGTQRGMPDFAAMRREASWQEYMLQLKPMGDVGKAEKNVRPKRSPFSALRAGSEKQRPKLDRISKQWKALQMSTEAMNHL